MAVRRGLWPQLSLSPRWLLIEHSPPPHMGLALRATLAATRGGVYTIQYTLETHLSRFTVNTIPDDMTGRGPRGEIDACVTTQASTEERGTDRGSDYCVPIPLYKLMSVWIECGMVRSYFVIHESRSI